MTEPASPDRTSRRFVARPRLLQRWAARAGASLARFREDSRGATAIEYGLIATLVFLAIATAIHTYADKVSVMYNYIGIKVTLST